MHSGDWRWLAVALLTLAMTACGGTSRTNALPEITLETDEGFYDLVFRIRDYGQRADGTTMFRAYGIHEGQTVGVTVVLGSAWERVSLGADLPSAFQGTVELRSLGVESDALLNVMDQLYGTKLHPKAMKPATVFTGITLEGNPRDVSRGVVKIKLFFEPDDEARYAELYANIDLPGGKLYVNEKDIDYRTPVIKALARPRAGG